jgi:hypothetical protein
MLGVGAQTHSPEELKAMRNDELEALSAIFGEDFNTLSDDGLFRVRCRVLALEGFLPAKKTDPSREIWLTVSLPPDYPDSPPIFELDSRGFLAYDIEERLYDTLLLAAQDRLGESMVRW